MGIGTRLRYWWQDLSPRRRADAAVKVVTVVSAVAAFAVACRGNVGDLVGDVGRIGSDRVDSRTDRGRDGSGLKERAIRVPMTDGKRGAAVELAEEGGGCVLRVRVPGGKNAALESSSGEQIGRNQDDNDVTVPVATSVGDAKVVALRDGRSITSEPFAVETKKDQGGKVVAQVVHGDTSTGWVKCSAAGQETGAALGLHRSLNPGSGVSLGPT